jgi:hypothetical protein
MFANVDPESTYFENVELILAKKKVNVDKKKLLLPI